MPTENEFEEKELLERLKNNDDDAFKEIYRHYREPLYHFIIRFVKLPSSADDILQDTFLKIWEIRQRINPSLSFKAYLYRISRNLVYKYLKKMAANEAIQVCTMYHFQPGMADAEGLLQWKQYQEKMNEAVSRLSPKREKVFRLCREQNKSYDEVAKELGISRNTVKEHMVLAMKSISEYLKINSEIPLSLLIVLLLGK